MFVTIYAGIWGMDIAACALCYNTTLVRDKPLGAPVSVKLISVSQHWLREWLGVEQTRSRGLFYTWPSSTTSRDLTKPQFVNLFIEASTKWTPYSLRWRHNERDGVPDHQPHDCFLNRLFRRWSKETSKFHVTGLCAENSPVTGDFPAQRASNAENVTIWWRHHVKRGLCSCHATLETVYNSYEPIRVAKESNWLVTIAAIPGSVSFLVTKPLLTLRWSKSQYNRK